MSPKIDPYNLVLVKKQNYAETGNTVVALINGYEATVKKYRHGSDYIKLIPLNPSYQTQIY